MATPVMTGEVEAAFRVKCLNDATLEGATCLNATVASRMFPMADRAEGLALPNITVVMPAMGYDPIRWQEGLVHVNVFCLPLGDGRPDRARFNAIGARLVGVLHEAALTITSKTVFQVLFSGMSDILFDTATPGEHYQSLHFRVWCGGT